MQTEVSFLKMCSLFIAVLLCGGVASAQESTPRLDAALQAKRFVFDVETVLPAGARARYMTGQGYGLRVSGDSLVSNLPYFGRAFSAPMSGRGGFNFSSVGFGYKIKARRRGGWEIELEPKDVADFRKFLLTVFDNGSATLRALSNNRQSISYNGTVQAL